MNIVDPLAFLTDMPPATFWALLTWVMWGMVPIQVGLAAFMWFMLRNKRSASPETWKKLARAVGALDLLFFVSIIAIAVIDFGVFDSGLAANLGIRFYMPAILWLTIWSCVFAALAERAKVLWPTQAAAPGAWDA